MRNIIAIIPARGGSKGIPGKNLRLLAGIPLIAHSIRAAHATPGISRTIVSTDDEEIRRVALSYQAEVVPRPESISGDRAASELALLHVLDSVREEEGQDPEVLVFLQPTSPLRRADDIMRALEVFFQHEADSLFSACHIEGFLWRRAGDVVEPVNYSPQQRKMRQQLDHESLEENGSIYILKPEILRNHGSRLGGRIAVYHMPKITSYQVDTPDDLVLLEKLFPLVQAPVAKDRFRDIRLIVFDFDGVMTDNKVLVDQLGIEAVFVHRGDGLGIGMIRNLGFEVMVLSTERNPVVRVRCEKLGIEVIQGSDDKHEALQALARQRGLFAEHIAFVGNDINDKKCMEWVGLPIAVADAAGEIRALAKCVTDSRGGHGVVREIADWIRAEHPHDG